MTIVIHPDGTQFPRNGEVWLFDHEDLWTCYSLWWRWDWKDQDQPVSQEWFSATIVRET